MRTFSAIIALSVALSLSACSGLGDLINGGATTADSYLNAACADATAVANGALAKMVPGVKDVTPYITSACSSASGIAKLAADPTSTAWLGQLTGMVKALAGVVGVKL